MPLDFKSDCVNPGGPVLASTLCSFPSMEMVLLGEGESLGRLGGTGNLDDRILNRVERKGQCRSVNGLQGW